MHQVQRLSIKCLRRRSFSAALLILLAYGSTNAPVIANSSGGRSRSGTFTPSQPAPAPRQTPRNNSPSRDRGPVYNPPNAYPNQPYFPPIPAPVYVPDRYPERRYPDQRERDFEQGRDFERNQFPAGSNEPLLPDRNRPNQPLNLPSSSPAKPQADYTWLWLTIAGVGLIGALALVYWIYRSRRVLPGSPEEVTNDVVCVSSIQVALLANCPIQAELGEIVRTMPVESPEQRQAQLQAVLLTLLRLPEYWSHVKIESQTFPTRTAAGTYFEQWSMQSRSKLSEETLIRDSFGVREKTVTINPDEDPAAYVVVSLLIGSTQDQALLTAENSSENLEQSLKKLATLRAEELLITELIWSPEESSDSLSREELMMEYGDLVMV
jgi:hypothetical protein